MGAMPVRRFVVFGQRECRDPSRSRSRASRLAARRNASPNSRHCVGSTHLAAFQESVGYRINAGIASPHPIDGARQACFTSQPAPSLFAGCERLLYRVTGSKLLSVAGSKDKLTTNAGQNISRHQFRIAAFANFREAPEGPIDESLWHQSVVIAVFASSHDAKRRGRARR